MASFSYRKKSGSQYFMAMHTCDALVVSCIDFRFHKVIDRWTEKNLKNELPRSKLTGYPNGSSSPTSSPQQAAAYSKPQNKTFDFVGFAGATKDLDTILKQIDISVRLHQINQVILIHHEDCGAYGDQSTLENHARDLRKARKEILEKHRDLQIDLYYVHLNGAFEKINP